RLYLKQTGILWTIWTIWTKWTFLHSIQTDNPRQGIGPLSTKYPAFFEKGIRLRTKLRWTGGKQKYTEADVSAFSREKKFFPFPPIPTAFIRNS
ncbi:MAG: hypothetical protein IKA32_02005, partial [Lentisphaeria bacterium]|nr:hypothetical protein [Lentisphaeria bacterium]